MNTDIAVIGMAGRFPDAKNINELYNNLISGRDSVKEISIDRIHATTIPESGKYMKCGYLENIDLFDYDLFKLSFAEAQAMGPYQRLMLEVAYETIEKAGYNPDYLYGTKTAVFVGEASSDYSKHSDEFIPTLVSGNAKEFLATRITKHFNFTGAAAMVDTACSSSLVALHLACSELILDNADYALACGINLYLFPYNDFSNDLDIYSTDGKSKSFSAKANGMSHGEAVTCVLLKPLDKALEDNDIIHAVIKSTVVNNNANRSTSPSAPDSASQAEVIIRAWEKAKVNCFDIGYIEAHGSGTLLGDCIEIEGLNLAFRKYTNQRKICPISTIKSNIGHGMSAAGLSSLIKVILSLKHQVLFPNINYSEPSPIIDFENSAVFINDTLKEWRVDEGKTRYAGISSMGVSGVNCHAVLMESPRREMAVTGDKQYSKERNKIVTVSSKSADCLRKNLQSLYVKLKEEKNLELQDISYTLNNGRKHYEFRFAEVVSSTEELVQVLEKLSNEDITNFKSTKGINNLIFIFSDHDESPDNLLNYFTMYHPTFIENYKACKYNSNNYDYNFNDFAFQYCFFKILEGYGITTNNILGIGIGKILRDVISKNISLKEALNRVNSYKKEDIIDIEKRVELLIDRETQKGTVVFVDMGVDGNLSKVIKKQCSNSSNCHVLSLSSASTCASPLYDLINQLYLFGYMINWKEFYKYHEGKKIELPTYSFNSTRCWLRDEVRKDIPNGKNKDHSIQNEDLFILTENITRLQKKIIGYWSKILNLNRISIDDDFFEVGGDSLNATTLIVEINRNLSINLSFEDVFDYPTIRLLSNYIESLLSNEKKLTSIWIEVLKEENIGLDDNFFELGGHSLIANHLIVKIEEEFELELNFEDIYNYPTIAQQCEYIDSLLEKSKGIKETNSKNILGNIKPFNDIFYKSCFYNSLFPAINHFNRSIIPIIINDVNIYCYERDKAGMQLNAKHLSCSDAASILKKEGVAFEVKNVESKDLISNIKNAIKNQRPVIIWVDCFYESIRPDMYMKEHWDHSLLVYGYNDENQMLNIIEHKHKENLFYRERTISYPDVVRAYEGNIKNFKENMPEYETYFEYYPVKADGHTEGEDYIAICTSNYVSKKAEILSALEHIKTFKANFIEITKNHSVLSVNLQDILDGLNNIINIKLAEKYKIINVLGEKLKYMYLMEKVIYNWNFIRSIFGKFSYSNKYKTEAINESITIIEEIYELECEFYKGLFSSLN